MGFAKVEAGKVYKNANYIDNYKMYALTDRT